MADPSRPPEPIVPTAALIAMRIVYAFNWFDIGAGLTGIVSQFGISNVEVGVLIAIFFIGAGLTQVPAGLLAKRWGTRRVAMSGAALLGVAAVASSLAPDYYALLALRFLVGVGAGLFFSPAIALVHELHPAKGRRGLLVGFFTSSFSIGAGLGVFLPAILVASFGWRGCLAIGGVLMLVTFMIGLPLVPRDAGRPVPARTPAPPSREWPAPLRSVPIWAIGFAFIGLEGASLSSSNFFFLYATQFRDASIVVAGLIGAFFVFPAVFGGPIGGWLAESFTNRRTQMFLLTAVPGTLLLLVPFVGLAEIAVVALAFSFCYGMVYPIMYIIPPYLPGLKVEDLPLSIGLLNAVQLAGGGLVAAFIGVVITGYGYTAAWAVMGITTVATLAFLVLIPRTGATYSTPGL